VFNVEFCGGPSGEEASAPFTVTPQEGDFDFNIYLKTRIIAAEDCTIDSALLEEIQSSANPRTHGIVQLERLPRMGLGDLAMLEEMGIMLMDYLNGISNPGTAYIASIAREIAEDNPHFDELVRCFERILPEDKIQLGLLPLPVPQVELDSVEPIDVLVQFFRDVTEEEAASIFDALGLEAQMHATPNVWQTTALPAQIESLAAEDLVQWIEAGPLPFMPTVDEVRDRSNVDVVQALNTTTGVYAGLSGAGVQIAIMDSGVDSQHNDFAGRIIRAQDDGGSHGTHVAGIAAGSGVQSDLTDDGGNQPFCCPLNTGTAFQWRGMAPEAGIAAYFQAGGNTGNYFDAINNFGVDVSNHSYVLDVQNQYSAAVASVDAIVRGDSAGIPSRPVVWAAANNASVGPRDCDGDGVPEGNFPQYPGGCPAGFQAGYFSILSPAKNPIDVGSIDKNRVHSGFSSMGPTMDGRLKPDVVAADSGVTSVRSDTFGGFDTDGDGTIDFFPGGNGYFNQSGTSMSSPAVAGIVALMLEQYADTFSVNLDVSPPLPSTLKAILVQTADDLAGTDPTVNFDTGAAVTYGNGPDWATGYGLADADAAVQLIVDEEFLEDNVDMTNPTDEYMLLVLPGQTEVKVTLAWDDIAGTPNANDAAAQLVNDLDLTLIEPDGTTHRPLVLPLLTPNDCDGNAANGIQVGTCPGQDPAGQNYLGPAAEGVDRRNNVEQVVVQDATGFECGIWTVRASVLNADGVTVRLPLGGTQPYSLAGFPALPPVPQIQIPSTNVSLDDTCVGDTSTQTMFVCNTSSLGDNLEVEDISSSDGQFAVTEPSSGFPVVISPDFCFPFEVTFSPSVSGTQSATLTVVTNDPCFPNVEVTVTGTGTEPDINTSIADNGDFGDVCLGDQRDLNLQVINQGGCDLEISNITTSNPEFILPSGLTPLILSPNANADIPIRFQPDTSIDCSDTTARTSDITITSNDPDEGTVTQAVSGIVPCPVATTSGELDFGELCVGESETQTVQVCDTGKCNLTVTRAELVPGAIGPDVDGCDDLTLVSPTPDDLPLVISPDFCFDFVVKFEPDDLIPPDCSLEIDTDDPDNPTITVPITATVGRADLVLDPAVLTGLYAFPATVEDPLGDLGCYSDRMLVARNVGTCPLVIDDMSATAPFSVIAPTEFPITLPPGEETLDVTVRLAPTSGGGSVTSPDDVTGTFTVVSNDPDGVETAGLCGEVAAQSGVRILLVDFSDTPIAGVDMLTLQSKGIHTPKPIHIRMTDVPVSVDLVCGNTVRYHMQQEDLPPTHTTGNDPNSSYHVRGREWNKQTKNDFVLDQCEFKEFILRLR
jgi:subtilisin family serine protease